MPFTIGASAEEIWNYSIRELTLYKGAVLLFQAYRKSDYMPCWSASTTSTTPVTYEDIMLDGYNWINIPMAELGLKHVFAVVSYEYAVARGGGQVSIKFYNLVSGGELVIAGSSQPGAAGIGNNIVDLTDFLRQGVGIRLRVTLAGDGINASSCRICHISIYGTFNGPPPEPVGGGIIG